MKWKICLFPTPTIDNNKIKTSNKTKAAAREQALVATG